MSGKVYTRSNVCSQNGCLNPVDAAVPHWSLVIGLYCNFHEKSFNQMFGTKK